MSLKTFSTYIADILEKNNGELFIEERDNDGIFSIKNPSAIEDNRGKNLDFFILSDHLDNLTRSQIYDDETAPFVIHGEGGRETEDSMERISLRILAKKTNKNTTKIFNAIKNKLKKDEAIGMGVQGGSQLHDHYFYQKKYVGKKVFKTDFYNDKASLIRVKEEQ
ncbi:hypothetical protein HHL17_16610 [Chitinophaga sp. G-6-1-13]|uniref:Uncharacterized protein n=1 Tax=Chitinophaga fulva TaxID=2728842 RepID=A0A848GQA7_9BACT|nr:hypothetical protein [Chitinophaga fulva]NML38830.1 hypothetical protein [Chitinophaga fulva]